MRKQRTIVLWSDSGNALASSRIHKPRPSFRITKNLTMFSLSHPSTALATPFRIGRAITISSDVGGYIFTSDPLMTSKNSSCRVLEELKCRCGRSRGSKVVQVFRLLPDTRAWKNCQLNLRHSLEDITEFAEQDIESIMRCPRRRTGDIQSQAKQFVPQVQFVRIHTPEST